MIHELHGGRAAPMSKKAEQKGLAVEVCLARKTAAMTAEAAAMEGKDGSLNQF